MDKKQLLSELHKIGVKVTKDGKIKRSDIGAALETVASPSHDMAQEIAFIWACDNIANVASEKPYSKKFQRSQVDILDSVPAALEDVSLKIEDYFDLSAAKNLISKIDTEWAGKLTVEDLNSEFGEKVPVSIAMQAAGHGMGLDDIPGLEDYLSEKGVSNFKARLFEPGLHNAFDAISDYEEKLNKVESSQFSKELEYWVTYNGGYEYGPFESEDEAKYAAMRAEKIDKENIATYRTGVLDANEPQFFKDFYQQKITEIEETLASRKIKKLG